MKIDKLMKLNQIHDKYLKGNLIIIISRYDSLDLQIFLKIR